MNHIVTLLYKVIIHFLLEEYTESACLFEITHPQHRMLC
jgi:hypothetical protein